MDEKKAYEEAITEAILLNRDSALKEVWKAAVAFAERRLFGRIEEQDYLVDEVADERIYQINETWIDEQRYKGEPCKE